MPWHLRPPGKANGDGLRRYSTLEASNSRHSEDMFRTNSSMGHLPLNSSGSVGPSPLSQESGFLPPSHAGHENRSEAPLSTTRPPQATRQNRFSLLKFRHASDPQLSSTYNAQAQAPPLPTFPPSKSFPLPVRPSIQFGADCLRLYSSYNHYHLSNHEYPRCTFQKKKQV